MPAIEVKLDLFDLLLIYSLIIYNSSMRNNVLSAFVEATEKGTKFPFSLRDWRTQWCTRDHNCLDTFFHSLVSADSPRYQRRYQRRNNTRRTPFAVEWAGGRGEGNG